MKKKNVNPWKGKKAFEECIHNKNFAHDGECDKCYLCKYHSFFKPCNILYQESCRNIIRSQQAEIKRLKEENKRLMKIAYDTERSIGVI